MSLEYGMYSISKKKLLCRGALSSITTLMIKIFKVKCTISERVCIGLTSIKELFRLAQFLLARTALGLVSAARDPCIFLCLTIILEVVHHDCQRLGRCFLEVTQIGGHRMLGTHG